MSADCECDVPCYCSTRPAWLSTALLFAAAFAGISGAALLITAGVCL